MCLWSNRRFRKILIWVSDHVFEDQILEWLYPGDMIIQFAGEKDVDES